MSTGPEHYEAAERCLQTVKEEVVSDTMAAELIGMAQVHATLALAFYTQTIASMQAQATFAVTAAMQAQAAAANGGAA